MAAASKRDEESCPGVAEQLRICREWVVINLDRVEPNFRKG